MSETDDSPSSDGQREAVLGERLAFEPLDRFRARSVVLQRLFGTRPAPQTVGRFVLRDRIGEGAMSTVYVADDPTLGREVALKIIGAPASDPAVEHERVLEEARAIAKLAHPSVVKVFGVSAVEGRWLMVMEYVEGPTLRGWLEARRPTFDEVLDVMTKVGQGLAAAHAAGVVHRDIKPENIVCATDGRVLLVDFGLATALPRSGDVLPRSRATAGSPAYLPAAQLRGEPAEPASDQFAFCVTLYEALVGRRPFPDPVDARALAARGAPPPAPAELPRWLWLILERGLRPAAVLRHASMEDLLAALVAGRRARKRKFQTLSFLGAVALCLGGAVFVGDRDGPMLCPDASPEIRRAWGPAARSDLESALHKATPPIDSASAVVADFDTYAEQWLSVRHGTCEAGLAGQLNSRELDATMGCLRDRRAELEALVTVLISADEGTLRDAPLAIRELDPPASCRGTAGRTLSAATGDALAQARAYEAAGLYGAGIAALEPHARDATSASDRAAIAFMLGVLYDRSGRPARGRVWLERALWDATAAGDDDLVLRAATSLIHVVGFALADDEGGRRWVQHARSALQRTGIEEHRLADLEVAEGLLDLGAGRFSGAERHLEKALEIQLQTKARALEIADIHTRLGNVALERGRFDASAEHHEKALGLRRGELGERHPVIGESLANLANAQLDQGDLEGGRATMLRSLTVLSESLGATHPIVAIVENNLGNLEADVGNDAAALPHYARAIEISRAAFGEDHPRVATMLDNRASVLRRLGRLDEARDQIETALSIRERKLGPEHPDIGYSCMSLGNLEAQVGHTDRALQLQRRALAIARAVHGEEHPNVGSALGNIAAVYLQLGNADKALEGYEQALSILGRTLEPQSPRLVEHLQGRGEAHARLGNNAEARRDFTRALEILQEVGGRAEFAGEIRALLARTR